MDGTVLLSIAVLLHTGLLLSLVVVVSDVLAFRQRPMLSGSHLEQSGGWGCGEVTSCPLLRGNEWDIHNVGNGLTRRMDTDGHN